MAYQPRGLKFDQLELGQTFTSPRRTVTEADVVAYAGLSGDFTPLHTDAVFMETHPFKQRIAHGMLGMSIATGLAYQIGIFDGTIIALMEMDIKYSGAIFFGDTVNLEIKVAEKEEPKKPDRARITFECNLLNQNGKAVIKSAWKCLMAR
jgi:acyl dehydratase